MVNVLASLTTMILVNEKGLKASVSREAAISETNPSIEITTQIEDEVFEFLSNRNVRSLRKK